MNIAITGAGGFIGSALCRSLEKSHTIMPIYSERTTQGFGLDLSREESIEKLIGHLRESDVIVHCAADKSEDALRINDAIDSHLLAVYAQIPARQLIYLSGLSIFEYANLDVVDETSEAHSHPHSYIHSRIMGEKRIKGFQEKPWSILRINAPYGAGMSEKAVMKRFVCQALQGEPLVLYGEGVREQRFMAVGDVCRAVEQVIAHHLEGVLHCFGREQVSMRQLAERVVRMCDSQSSIILDQSREETILTLPQFQDRILSRYFPDEEKTSLQSGITQMVKELA